MSAVVRLSLLLLVSLAVAVAQEAAPSPTPSASPSPSATPAPEATPEASPEATPESSPSPTSVTEEPPAPALEPAAPETPPADIIPMEGQPTGGAPLDTQNLSPSPDGSVPDAAFTDPNSIVPDEPPGPPAMPQTVESAEQKERELNIRYREVRVKAEEDPKVIEMAEKADTAKTDEDKRAARREYYRLLFKKMVSLDKSLADKCTLMEQAYLRRLAQERLEPTIPLNPPPTPSPLAN